MNANLMTAMSAINKWIFFGWNYDSREHEWNGVGGKKSDVLPVFLIEARWSCDFDHMVEKWRISTKDAPHDAYMLRFYASLDAFNRRAFLEWVMDNYDDEGRIF